VKNPRRRHTTAELVAGRPDRATMDATRMPVTVVLDNVRSLQNVGLVFRVCDCANIGRLILSGITGTPVQTVHAVQQIGKTAVGGSLQTVPWEKHDDPMPRLAELRRAGHQLVVFEQAEGSIPYREVPYRFPLVAVFGHERDGVRDELLQEADYVAELPVRGITNSLNVAMTVSIVLYEFLARWNAAR
jgi:23S rRNA (guanosine2251-2'-O)-methyltransferase